MNDRRDHRQTAAVSALDAVTTIDDQLQAESVSGLRTVATGLRVLDEVLGDGLHRGELVLLGGPPGVGKTALALQIARNIARGGARSVFACYEHDATTLATRLLALEAGDAGGDHMLTRSLARALARGASHHRSLDEVLAETDAGRGARERVEAYGEDLVLVRASGSHTTVEELVATVDAHSITEKQTVLFVDYLQKVPLHPEPSTEAEKVTRTVEALKDLALDLQIPVVLLSAVDAEGMQASRIRMHHLRGSSAIAFESDVVLMINDKEKAVSKVHLTYDPVRARTYRDWVVMSVEKNRGGPNLVDLEFEKDFAHFRFDPDGGLVTEKLVSERLDEANL